MRAGSLDERIKIREPAETIDALGDEVEPWPVLIETWAEMVEIGAAEVLRNPQIAGQLTATFKIRHPGVSLNSRMRVEDAAGRLYEITAISALPQRREGFVIQAKGLDKTGATVA